MFQAIRKFVLDLFFPKKCLACGKANTYLCDSCFNKIACLPARQEIVQNNKCPFCDRPVAPSQICKKCKERYFLDKLIWATPYSSALIKELIKAFKYLYIKELAKPLAHLLIAQCGTLDLPHNVVVMPIPLHKQRLRERDFNQAELLAKEVARYFSIPLETEAIKRTRFTTPQVKIKDHKTRRANIKNIFEINPKFAKKCVTENKNLLKDKTIILIDDVFTTGATLSEAAKVLKQAGVKEVWGLVVAKG